MKRTKYLALVAMSALSFLSYATEVFAQATDIIACGPIMAAGSYKLANNLTATGDCLVLAAGVTNVTIDLGGFTIAGNGTGSGIVSNTDTEGIVIQNGTITGFGRRGIDLLSSTRTRVERMTISGNAGGVFVNRAAIVRNNVVTGNDAGILVGNAGVVTDNIVAFNTGSGAFTGIGSTVTGNSFVENGLDGLIASNGSTITNNTARGNTIIGLRIVCPSNVLGNTATDNAGGNLLLGGAGCNSEHNLAP